MKWFFCSLFILFLFSCLDFDRSKHIKEINSSILELEHCLTELKSPKFDSIPIVLSEIKQLNEHLRRYIKQDTLSLETALKIDEYKSIEATITQLTVQIPITENDIKTVINDLKNLENDISNNAGDRANYSANLAVENENKKVLVEASKRYTTDLSSSINRFNSIHSTLKDFSIQLEMKNKEQNLIP